MTLLSQTQPDFLNEKSYDLTALEIVFSDFLKRRCWLCSSSDKRPFNPRTKNGSWNDPDLLCTFAEMAEFLNVNQAYMPCMIPAYAGIFCIDFDKLKAQNELFPQWALDSVREMASFTEVSQSRTGLHVFLKGTAPGPKTVGNFKGVKVEFLSRHCISLTGNMLENFDTLRESNPYVHKLYDAVFPALEDSKDTHQAKRSPPLSNAEAIELLNKASNREKFSKLFYDGRIDEYAHDASSADFALVSLIAFYIQKPDQLFEIFKESALYKNPERRAKWARDDYRTATIAKAVAGCKEFYQPAKEKSSEGKRWSWEHPLWPAIDGEPVDTPFPIHCLPKVMQAAVAEVARDVRVDVSMASIAALGVLALVIGKKAIVIEKRGLEHHPSFFFVCKALPVERKSETYRRILDPLRDLLEIDIEEWRRSKDRIIAHNESVLEEIAVIKSKIRDVVKKPNYSKKDLCDLKEFQAKLKQTLQEIPPHPKNWSDDVTPEKLKRNLFANKGVYGLFSSEGRSALHVILNKDGLNATAKSLFTSATWGDPIDRDRISGGEAGEGEKWELRWPAMTVVLFVQPDAWEAFSGDPTMRSSGTLSRICLASPRSLVGSRLEFKDDEPYKIGEVLPFVNRLNAIRKWDPEQPLRVPLSEEAAELRRQFFNSWETSIAEGAAYEDVPDIVGRSASIASRLALLLSICRTDFSALGQPTEITREDWLDAQEIQEWFLTNGIDSLRSRTRSRQDCENRVFTWLCKNFHEGRQDVLPSFVKNRCRLKNDEVKDVIASLVNKGVLRVTKKSRGKSFYYEINPQIPFIDEDNNEN